MQTTQKHHVGKKNNSNYGKVVTLRKKIKCVVGTLTPQGYLNFSILETINKYWRNYIKIVVLFVC